MKKKWLKRLKILWREQQAERHLATAEIDELMERWQNEVEPDGPPHPNDIKVN